MITVYQIKRPPDDANQDLEITPLQVTSVTRFLEILGKRQKMIKRLVLRSQIFVLSILESIHERVILG